MDHPLEGWDIAELDAVAWVPWGSDGNARAKLLAAGDGYNLALVEADAGYASNEHEHAYTGNQGKVMKAGDGYVAAAGSRHTDFATDTGARYLSIFKL